MNKITAAIKGTFEPPAGKRKFTAWMIGSWQLLALAASASIEDPIFRDTFLGLTAAAVLGFMAEYAGTRPAEVTLRKFKIWIVGSFQLTAITAGGLISGQTFRDCYIGLTGAVLVGYMAEYNQKRGTP